MKKREISLILCLLLAGSSISCGGEDIPDDTTASDVTTTEAVSAELTSGVPVGTKFDGETVTFLNSQYHSRFYYLLDASESNGDTINDAVYNRNVTVQEKLGVTFEFVEDDNSKVLDKVRSAVMSDDDSWDIILGMQYRMTTLTLENLMYDLADAPYIDVSQPWWAGDYIQMLNVNDKHRYMLVGDFSIGYLNQMGVIYYNKNMMEEYYQDGDLLYKEVLDGTWTLDRLYELSSSAWRDLNGNNTTDFSDQVGFCLDEAAFTTNHLFYDAGGSVCEYDSSGNLTLNGLTDRNIGITEKIYKLFFDNPGWVVPPDITKETGETDIPQKFSEGTMLFDIGLLSTADHLRDMKDDYGIIPYPKYDESIEDYRALVHDQAATFCLPITSDNVELCSAVMEEMSFQGYQTVVPEYYSVVLKQKYMRDDQSDAMQIMDIIHDSGFTDVGFMQNYNLNRIGAVCIDCITNKNNSYATKYAELITAAEEKFDTLMEFYNN